MIKQNKIKRIREASGQSEEAIEIIVLVGWSRTCDREGHILPKTEGGMEVSHVKYAHRP